MRRLSKKRRKRDITNKTTWTSRNFTRWFGRVFMKLHSEKSQKRHAKQTIE